MSGGHLFFYVADEDDNALSLSRDALEFRENSLLVSGSREDVGSWQLHLISTVNHGRLSEIECRTYFQQLIDGVHFCHSKGVYHRDLKPENLLLDSQSSRFLFGLSAFTDFHSLPAYLKEIEFILNHYRFDWPLNQVLLSIFTIHNETLNVWT